MITWTRLVFRALLFIGAAASFTLASFTDSSLVFLFHVSLGVCLCFLSLATLDAHP